MGLEHKRQQTKMRRAKKRECHDGQTKNKKNGENLKRPKNSSDHFSKN